MHMKRNIIRLKLDENNIIYEYLNIGLITTIITFVSLCTYIFLNYFSNMIISDYILDYICGSMYLINVSIIFLFPFDTSLTHFDRIKISILIPLWIFIVAQYYWLYFMLCLFFVLFCGIL